MKEFVISEAQVETAILVGLITQAQDERKTNEYLDELAFLAETAGAEVVKKFTQKLPTANSVTYVGKGKLEEIKEYILNEEWSWLSISTCSPACSVCGLTLNDRGVVPDRVVVKVAQWDFVVPVKLSSRWTAVSY